MPPVAPWKITEIEKVQPTKAFKRMLFFMTAGGVGDQQEVETFTAISILQQIFKGLTSVGINNIVRLAKDDMDYYIDNEGKKMISRKPWRLLKLAWVQHRLEN